MFFIHRLTPRENGFKPSRASLDNARISYKVSLEQKGANCADKLVLIFGLVGAIFSFWCSSTYSKSAWSFILCYFAHLFYSPPSQCKLNNFAKNFFFQASHETFFRYKHTNVIGSTYSFFFISL